MTDQKRTKFGPPTMALAQRTKHSSLIAENKEEIAAMLLGMTSVPITDVVQWTADGRMLVKSSNDLQGFAAHAIKKIRQVTDKDGNLVIEVEARRQGSVDADPGEGVGATGSTKG